MAALAVVEDDVNELIDQILDLLPVVEVRREIPVPFRKLFLRLVIHSHMPLLSAHEDGAASAG
jgi:hypothetical protein